MQENGSEHVCLWCVLDAVDAVREANDTVDRLKAAQDEANDKWYPAYQAKEEALEGLRNREVSLYETLDRIHTAVRSEREAWDTYTETGAAYHRARKDKAAALNELFAKADRLRETAKPVDSVEQADEQVAVEAKPSEPPADKSPLKRAHKMAAENKACRHFLAYLVAGSEASDEDIAVGLAILTILEMIGEDSAPIARDKIAEMAGTQPAKVTSSAKKLVEMDWITREAGQAFPVSKSGQKDRDEEFLRRHTVYGYGPCLINLLDR